MFGRRRSGAASATDLSKSERAYLRVMNSRPMHAPLTMQLAGVFFAVVVALGLFLLISPSESGTSGTATAAPTVSQPPTPTAPAASPDSAGLINGCATQDAVEVPPEMVALTEFSTQWRAIGQLSIPGSSSGGPAIQEPPHCFTRTPEGALYSIATFFAKRAQAGSNEGFVEVMNQRCLHDSNYEAYTTRLLADSPVLGVPVTAISGYRWMEYSPERATVELQFKLVTGPDAGKTTSNVFSVIWSNNDWLILVPHPDQPTAVPGNNLRTFHTWGATG